MEEYLTLGGGTSPIRPQNGGLFVSRGKGTHPRRTLSSFELIFVAAGTLSMWEEKRRFDLVAGQSLLLWPGREHAGAEPYSDDCSFYWVHFVTSPSPFAECNKLPPYTLPQTATVARPNHLRELFRRFLDDQETGLLELTPASYLLLLMLHEVALSPTWNVDSEATDGAAAILARHAKQYTLSHLGEPLTTAKIADALHCHPDYLGRCFRATFGSTLTAFIHQHRLWRARTLLLDTNHSVEEVARECGFPNVIFFRRLFRRHEGMSPTAFRQLYARVHMNSV